MSYREVQSLIQLGIGLVVVGFYGAMALGWWDEGEPSHWFFALVTCVLFTLYLWEERRKEAEDERDRLIRHRAYSLAMTIAFVAIFALAGLSGGLLRSAPVDSALLLCLLTAALTLAAAFKLYLYRRGA